MSVIYCPCGHVEDNDQHACPVTYERLRKKLSAALQQKERFKERCWALSVLLYPYGEPRIAVAGDLGLTEHP